jgi:hypothetical protein
VRGAASEISRASKQQHGEGTSAQAGGGTTDRGDTHTPHLPHSPSPHLLRCALKLPHCSSRPRTSAKLCNQSYVTTEMQPANVRTIGAPLLLAVLLCLSLAYAPQPALAACEAGHFCYADAITIDDQITCALGMYCPGGQSGQICPKGNFWSVPVTGCNHACVRHRELPLFADADVASVA